jgi:exodeoxyribonuclease III
MDCFNEYARTFIKSKEPVALIGDYNVVPTDFDIYNPRSWRKDALLQPQTRGRYQTLMAQGWTDSIRHLFPQEPIYTFWDYFRQHWEHNSGLRIDHLLLNPALKRSLKTGGVDKWVRGRPGAGDHAPTWVEVNERR